MGLFRTLPKALAALVLISPVFAASPTCFNDPFRAISLQVNKEPELPVCCLTPLSPVEPVEDEVFLSFEEWKEKQHSVKASNNSNKSGQTSTMLSGSPAVSLPPTPSDQSPQDVPESQPEEQVSPHFRVPLTDRFNYASLDCSARVHTSHRSAKSPSSILSHKKDRYMLSPCNSKESKFVAVELCDDIRIDTVQLANFEFFSGVFKDFKVSVAKTYSTNPEDWTVAGTYTAKNVRGVQSFHPPRSLRDFYRFIRIDFLSHYSAEYYCPVSLLRVYGLTHLEEWKWEVWEEESRAKRDGLAELAVESPSAPLDVEDPLPAHAPDSAQPESDMPVESNVTSLKSATTAPVPVNDSTFTEDPAPPSSSPDDSESSEDVTYGIWAPASSEELKDAVTTSNDTNDYHIHETPIISVTSSEIPTQAREPASSISDTSHFSSKLPISETVVTDNSSSFSTTESTANSHSTTSSASSAPAAPPSAPSTTGGESIYRTIMNRLTALEANHTLYARYLEEQTSGVREMIKRLGEDVGRLEGIGRAQAQMYQKQAREWEKQSRRLEVEYMELYSRVNHLSDEVVLEKRLGIAQLCLLILVLVFMALTRGSRAEEHVPRRAVEWSRRHLSFSSDWVSRFTGGRSRSRSQSPMKRKDVTIKRHDDVKIEFPSVSNKPKKPPRFPTRPKSRENSRSRTSSLRSPVFKHYNLQTPSQLKPQLVRSNSQGWTGVGPVPKSAKRFARTAHLHEVPVTEPTKLRSKDLASQIRDVFTTATPTPPERVLKKLTSQNCLSSEEEGGISPTREGGGEVWVDTDASIDGESDAGEDTDDGPPR